MIDDRFNSWPKTAAFLIFVAFSKRGRVNAHLGDSWSMEWIRSSLPFRRHNPHDRSSNWRCMSSYCRRSCFLSCARKIFMFATVRQPHHGWYFEFRHKWISGFSGWQIEKRGVRWWHVFFMGVQAVQHIFSFCVVTESFVYFGSTVDRHTFTNLQTHRKRPNGGLLITVGVAIQHSNPP